ncbi:LysE/ArgO family amino acid transporter [Allohahella sp. A8]|uniref:LysE/ArgO family amino acid transporter n=1 Tax=Allohahella sp. A8 TaxID=3141461 RepID=UPI000C0B1114|nr:lysine transporter LysE [Hahellaceae bacterium]|tara:strand:- start:17029 stop:17640 length:612 start_codon:yes stop_codon:yes gene_type:complete
MGSLSTGFVVGLGLIVAIGAQNAWVLSQSMRGNHRGVIATVCIVCDAGLIFLGVFGIAQIQARLPPLIPVLTWLGVGLLLWLAAKAALRAYKGSSALQASDANATSAKDSMWKTGATALAITLLNPHVYLDTVVLIGSVGAQQAAPLWFAAGACLASFCWFTALTQLAPKLRIWLRSPLHWRLFDSGMAGLLFVVAVSLVPLS